MYYLRKISRGKWPKESEIASATLKDISADTVISEFKNIDNNKLSVWCVDSEEDINDAFIALGSNCDNLSTIFAVKIPEEYVSELSFDSQEGDTPTFGINDKHRNIVDLNYETLGEVIKATIRSLREENTMVRITKAKLRELMVKAYEENKLDVEHLKEGLRRDMKIE